MKRRDFLKTMGAAPAAALAKDMPETPCHEWEYLDDTIVGVVYLNANEITTVSASVIQDETEMVECEYCGELYCKIVRKKGYEIADFKIGTHKNGERIVDRNALCMPVSGRNPEIRVITDDDLYYKFKVKETDVDLWIL